MLFSIAKCSRGNATDISLCSGIFQCKNSHSLKIAFYSDKHAQFLVKPLKMPWPTEFQPVEVKARAKSGGTASGVSVTYFFLPTILQGMSASHFGCNAAARADHGHSTLAAGSTRYAMARPRSSSLQHSKVAADLQKSHLCFYLFRHSKINRDRMWISKKRSGRAGMRKH